eukprot:snap_masked-scaffold_40-processed-gene-2.32-mRNA-1 protein AED:1.00 eAED:1.00 QI:0/-1/0/0/-1/1/1/0/552
MGFVFVFALVVVVLGEAGASSCDNRALNNLNADKCFDEIQEQFNWNSHDIPDQFELCLPTHTYFIFDSSATIRRTCKQADDFNPKCLVDVQRSYISNFLSFLNPMRKDYFESIFYATDAFQMDVSPFTDDKVESFLSDVDSFLETEFYESKFTSNRKGWSRASEGFYAVQQHLEEVYSPENIDENVQILSSITRPVIVLFTDGRLERRLGGIAEETKRTETAVADLKLAFPDSHVHCVLLRLEGEKSREFWREESICDSKDLYFEVGEDNMSFMPETERFEEKFAYLKQRRDLCSDPGLFESFVPSEVPTGRPTTLSPTNTPSLAPSKSPTCTLEKEVALFNLENVVVNNLCGVNSRNDELITPAELRFDHVFLSDPELEVVVTCNDVDLTSEFVDKNLSPLENSEGFLSLDIPIKVELPLNFEVVKKDGSVVEGRRYSLTVYDIDATEDCSLVKERVTFCSGIASSIGNNLQVKDAVGDCDLYESSDIKIVEDPDNIDVSLLSEDQVTRVVTRHFLEESVSVKLGSMSYRDVSEEETIKTYLSLTMETPQC